jgi:nucleoside-triphosphatase THEP1
MLVHAPLVVLTGPSGSGKSTICRFVADEARRRRIPAGGVTTASRMADGVRVGLDAVDVASGARVPLAELDRPTGGHVTGRWHFHEPAFAAGLNWCDRTPSTALLVVDELGPLELLDGRGWAPVVPGLATRLGPVLVAVRPALAGTLSSAIGPRAAVRVDVTPATREAATARVFAALGLVP